MEYIMLVTGLADGGSATWGPWSFEMCQRTVEIVRQSYPDVLILCVQYRGIGL